jgi:hypothetical protein
MASKPQLGAAAEPEHWIPGSFDREVLRSALLAGGAAGVNSHDRPNVLWKIKRLCDGDPQPLGRHVHARPRADRAAADHLPDGLAAGGPHHRQLGGAVGQQDAVPRLEPACQVGVGGRRSARVATPSGSKDELASGLEGHLAALKLAETNLGSREVGHDADRPAGVLCRRPHRPDQPVVLISIAVRAVDPGHVHAGLDQLPHPPLAGRADRADELGRSHAPAARRASSTTPSMAVRSSDPGGAASDSMSGTARPDSRAASSSQSCGMSSSTARSAISAK